MTDCKLSDNCKEFVGIEKVRKPQIQTSVHRAGMFVVVNEDDYHWLDSHGTWKKGDKDNDKFFFAAHSIAQATIDHFCPQKIKIASDEKDKQPVGYSHGKHGTIDEMAKAIIDACKPEWKEGDLAVVGGGGGWKGVQCRVTRSDGYNVGAEMVFVPKTANEYAVVGKSTFLDVDEYWSLRRPNGEDWLKRFYTETAKETVARTTDTLELLKASRLKWNGLDKDTLGQYGLVSNNAAICDVDGDVILSLDCSSCVQCVASKRCNGCPLNLDGKTCEVPDSAYQIFCDTSDPSPMQALIDKAIAAEKVEYVPLERRREDGKDRRRVTEQPRVREHCGKPVVTRCAGVMLEYLDPHGSWCGTPHYYESSLSAEVILAASWRSIDRPNSV